MPTPAGVFILQQKDHPGDTMGLLENEIGSKLKARGLTLATAESCTGGLVAHRVTNVPGSSDYFPGGLVAYANQIKQNILNVPEDILARYGAVSAETVAAMAAGAADNGKPGARIYYDPRYYAANILDPDGYSIEAVYKSWQHPQP